VRLIIVVLLALVVAPNAMAQPAPPYEAPGTEDVAETVATERNPSDDPAYKKALLVSGGKREYAAKRGVDGNLTVSAALMPVGGAAGRSSTEARS
jgi:hypothetical protein